MESEKGSLQVLLLVQHMPLITTMRTIHQDTIQTTTFLLIPIPIVLVTGGTKRDRDPFLHHITLHQVIIMADKDTLLIRLIITIRVIIIIILGLVEGILLGQ